MCGKIQSTVSKTLFFLVAIVCCARLESVEPFIFHGASLMGFSDVTGTIETKNATVARAANGELYLLTDSRAVSAFVGDVVLTVFSKSVETSQSPISLPVRIGKADWLFLKYGIAVLKLRRLLDASAARAVSEIAMDLDNVDETAWPSDRYIHFPAFHNRDPLPMVWNAEIIQRRVDDPEDFHLIELVSADKCIGCPVVSHKQTGERSLCGILVSACGSRGWYARSSAISNSLVKKEFEVRPIHFNSYIFLKEQRQRPHSHIIELGDGNVVSTLKLASDNLLIMAPSLSLARDAPIRSLDGTTESTVLLAMESLLLGLSWTHSEFGVSYAIIELQGVETKLRKLLELNAFDGIDIEPQTIEDQRLRLAVPPSRVEVEGLASLRCTVFSPFLERGDYLSTVTTPCSKIACGQPIFSEDKNGLRFLSGIVVDVSATPGESGLSLGQVLSATYFENLLSDAKIDSSANEAGEISRHHVSMRMDEKDVNCFITKIRDRYYVITTKHLLNELNNSVTIHVPPDLNGTSLFTDYDDITLKGSWRTNGSDVAVFATDDHFATDYVSERLSKVAASVHPTLSEVGKPVFTISALDGKLYCFRGSVSTSSIKEFKVKESYTTSILVYPGALHGCSGSPIWQIQQDGTWGVVGVVSAIGRATPQAASATVVSTFENIQELINQDFVKPTE